MCAASNLAIQETLVMTTAVCDLSVSIAESKPHEPLCKVAKRHMPTSLLFSPLCRWLLPLHSFYFTLSRVCR